MTNYHILKTLQFNYINAYAATTQVGDLAEINAIKKVFKDTFGIKMNGILRKVNG